MVDLLQSDDFSLLKLLESHIFIGLFIPGEFDPAERSCAERLEDFIVCEFEFFGFIESSHEAIKIN